MKPMLLMIVVVFAFAGGCAYQANEELMSAVAVGEFGRARESAILAAETDPKNRNYMLDRQKILITALADGTPSATEGNVDVVYDYLRAQGLNEDRTVGSILVGEGLARIWKGEPYEQAIAYCHIAAFDGLRGDWGNVRASASNSLFLLRDFSDAIARGRTVASENQKFTLSEDESVAAREAIAYDLANRGREAKDAGKKAEEVEPEYRLVPSDFELGYVLTAIANDQLNQREEREEALRGLQSIAPRLKGYARSVRSGRYNTVVMVDYGFGPEKYATGYDNVIEAYRPRMPSGDEPLVVRWNGQSRSFPVVTDINRLAEDTKWANLEGFRKAKSVVGTGLVTAGAVVMGTSDKIGRAHV